MKKGLCLYCGEKGHVAHNCPKSAASKACLAKALAPPPKAEPADSKKQSTILREMLLGLGIVLTLPMQLTLFDSMHLLFLLPTPCLLRSPFPHIPFLLKLLLTQAPPTVFSTQLLLWITILLQLWLTWSDSACLMELATLSLHKLWNFQFLFPLVKRSI